MYLQCMYNVCITLENTDQKQFIQKEFNLSYLTTSKDPINEFTSEGYISGYIACTFPRLYPIGNGDYLQPKRIPNRFRFFALNTIMRHNTINMSNLCMKSIKDKNCTITRLREMIKTDLSILGRIMVIHHQ